MYEVLSGQYPYYGLQPETVIWKTCTNHRQSLDKVNATRVLTVRSLKVRQTNQNMATMEIYLVKCSKYLKHLKITQRAPHRVTARTVVVVVVCNQCSMHLEFLLPNMYYLYIGQS